MTELHASVRIEELLQHMDWVRGLARRLVSDPAVADDVVQDTWLAALRRPPRTGLRAWLRKVAQNFARQRARAEGRRSRRELDAARDEALPATDDMVARAELQRAIVSATLALPEASREVLLLHYFEGRPLRDIAIALELPLETVRTRHKRALAAVRSKLDAGPGGRRGWVAVAVPMGLGSNALGMSAAVSTGGVLMASKTKLLAAAGVAALCLVGYQMVVDDPTQSALSGAKEERASLAGAPADQHAPGGVDEEGGASVGNEPAKPERDKVERPHGATPFVECRGTLVGLLRGVPWTARLVIGNRAVAVDRSGAFVFRVERDTPRVEIAGDDPRYMPFVRKVRVLDGACEVRVEVAAVVRGRLRFADRQPVRGGRVSIHPMASTEPAANSVARLETQDDGSFWLRTTFDGRALLVLAAPSKEFERDERENPPRRHLALPKGLTTLARPGVVTDVEDVMLVDGREISGRVRFAGGKGIAGARIRAEGFDLDGSVEIFAADLDLRWWPDGTLAEVETEADTDKRGVYRLRGLLPRKYELRLQYFSERQILHLGDVKRAALAPATGVDFDLNVSRTRVRVVHDGKAIRSAHIGAERDGLMFKGSSYKGTTDLLLEPGQKYHIIVTAEGYRPLRVPHVASTGRTSRVLAMEPRPTRTLRVRLAGARDIAKVWVDLRPADRNTEDAKRLSADVALQKGGRFDIATVPPGRYLLAIRRPRSPSDRFADGVFLADVATVIDVPAGRGVHRQTVQVRRGGRLRVAVVDGQGSYLKGTCRVFGADGKEVRTGFMVGDRGGYVRGGPGALHPRGANEASRVFLPGSYDVEVAIDGHAKQRERLTIRPGEVAEHKFTFSAR